MADKKRKQETHGREEEEKKRGEREKEGKKNECRREMKERDTESNKRDQKQWAREWRCVSASSHTQKLGGICPCVAHTLKRNKTPRSHHSVVGSVKHKSHIWVFLSSLK